MAAAAAAPAAPAPAAADAADAAVPPAGGWTSWFAIPSFRYCHIFKHDV